jgi:hypothetical protein
MKKIIMLLVILTSQALADNVHNNQCMAEWCYSYSYDKRVTYNNVFSREQYIMRAPNYTSNPDWTYIFDSPGFHQEVKGRQRPISICNLQMTWDYGTNPRNHVDYFEFGHTGIHKICSISGGLFFRRNWAGTTYAPFGEWVKVGDTTWKSIADEEVRDGLDVKRISPSNVKWDGNRFFNYIRDSQQ